MKLRMKKLAALLVTGAVLASVAGCGSNGSKEQNVVQESSQTVEDAVETGLFQDMDTKDLEGNAIDSSIFAENKLTLVNVWNIGCPPCIREIPVLDQLNKDYAEKGVAVKGMYYNFGADISEEDRAAIQEVLTDAGAEYTHIVPSQSMYETEEMMDIQAFPTTYYVDSEGNIVDEVVGADDYEGWKEKIEKILEKVEE